MEQTTVKFTNNPGLEGEWRVRLAFQEILENEPPELAALGKGVKRFIHARQNSRLDKKKIDFLVVLKDTSRIFVQVKTSVRKMAKFRHKMSKWKNIFLLLMVRVDDEIAAIKKMIIDGLIKLFEEAKKQFLTDEQREEAVNTYLDGLSDKDRKARQREIRADRRAERQKHRRWCFRPQVFAGCH